MEANVTAILGGGPLAATTRPAPTNSVHHWQQGPADLIPLNKARTRWKFLWYLDSHPGLTRKQALALLYGVINHPLSWERAGVQFARTMDARKANVWVRVAPASNSACGPGSAGCYSWGHDATTDKPVVHIGSEYVGDPGAWAVLVNMELGGHACFRMLDMYNPVHQPYQGGVMGTWGDAARTSFFPSQLEIDAAKAWLRGEAKYVHDD